MLFRRPPGAGAVHFPRVPQPVPRVSAYRPRRGAGRPLRRPHHGGRHRLPRQAFLRTGHRGHRPRPQRLPCRARALPRDRTVRGDRHRRARGPRPPDQLLYPGGELRPEPATDRDRERLHTGTKRAQAQTHRGLGGRSRRQQQRHAGGHAIPAARRPVRRGPGIPGTVRGLQPRLDHFHTGRHGAHRHRARRLPGRPRVPGQVAERARGRRIRTGMDLRRRLRFHRLHQHQTRFPGIRPVQEQLLAGACGTQRRQPVLHPQNLRAGIRGLPRTRRGKGRPGPGGRHLRQMDPRQRRRRHHPQPGALQHVLRVREPKLHDRRTIL